MRSGTGVGLLLAGAVLYWVVDIPAPFVNGHALGGILMVAGAIALVAGMVADARRSQPNAEAGIGLITVGAVLCWAVRFTIPGVNAAALGVLLMVVGVITVAAAVYMNFQRSRTRNVVEYRYK